MKKREDTRLPEFQSLDEEEQYWEEHGPLGEGHKGRVNKPKPGQKRSSFLAVRLTGEELTRLRNIAAQQGIGPSTFARLVLTAAIEQEAKMPRRITMDELKARLEDSLPQSVKDRAEALARATAIGDLDNPSFILMDVRQMRKATELFTVWLSALGVPVVTLENERYEETRDIVKAQS